MALDHVQGIVLHRKVFFEQDLIIEVFSEQYGKLNCIAKSAAKIQSKLSGKLNPLNVVSLHLYKGKSFYTITDCKIVENVSDIREHFNELQLALFFVSICRASLEFNQPHKDLYHLLLQSLRDCNANKALRDIKAYFYSHYLKCEGISPPDSRVISDDSFIALVQQYCEKKLSPPLFIY